MVAAANHDVVDPPTQLQRPVVTAGHQRVAWRERVPRIPGVHTLPGVPVADARLAQGLQSAPEAHASRSEEHTSELQSRQYLVCRLLLEKKKNIQSAHFS